MGRTKTIPVKFNGASHLENSRLHKARKKSNYKIGYNVLPPDDSNKQYCLGEIWLGRSNNILPETWLKCKVSVISVQSLQMDFDSNTTVLVNITNDFTFVKGLFTSKIFAMEFHNRDDSLFAKLHISKLPLPRFNKIIGNTIQTAFATIFDIQIQNGEVKSGSEKLTEAKEITQLYKNVKTVQEGIIQLPNVCVQHTCLKPKLRPYQEDAVRWMLLREMEPNNTEMLHPLFQEISLKTGTTIYFDKHTGYVDATRPIVSSLRTGGILADEMGLGKTIEVLACILCHPKPDELNDSITSNVESLDNLNNSDNDVSPMIQKQSKKRKSNSDISDSQENYVDAPKKSKVPEDWVKSSSRKSHTRVALELWYENMLQEVSIRDVARSPANRVQCICGDTEIEGCNKCIDCYKYQHSACLGYKKKFGDYRCPQCWMNHPLLESQATLIVCPLSLQSQWCEEICKHVGAGLKVLVYEGSKAASVYPTKLKDYDLVLTTYNVLQAELRLSETGQVITLRREPRYSAPGSPLTLIKWWRLCLDEAQTVEVPSCMISTMAKKLHAHHRWGITGTPICRDISGLYGLIDYLQLEPYNEAETWNNLLYLPYLSDNTQPMLQFLAQVMWRSSKDDVIEQINIPNQTVNEHLLEFSAVEKFYYKREHEICTSFFLHKLRGYDTSNLLRSLDKSRLKKLMTPLLAIRQACTHPSATRGRYLASRKTVTSMKGLLDALIEKNINDSEDNLRVVVSALNGLAGIYLLLQNPVQAVAEYRKVLQLAARFNAEDTKKGLTVDKLQLIHTIHNLADVLEAAPPVQPTLRDHTLRQDCLIVQEKYMEKYINQNLISYEETRAATNAVTKWQEKCTLEPGQWYFSLVDWVTMNDLTMDLRSRIQTALDNASNQTPNISNERKLLYVVRTWDQDKTEARTATIGLLDKIYDYHSENERKIVIAEGLVQAAMECHLRPQKKSKNKKCLVCKISVQMRQYEAILFDMTKHSEDISNKGSWKPTSQELMLKALLALGRAKYAEQEWVKDGEIYFNILDASKKEFKQMRKFWTYLDQQICAHDEINICKTRLSLKEPTEEQQRRQSRTTTILKQLSTVLENKLEFINLIGEHELVYQVSVLQNEERQNMAMLERNLGTHSYLQTLRGQQYAGQSPDPCPICKNALQDQWSILPCGHSYCLECIQLLLEKTGSNRSYVFGASSNRVSCSVCRQLQKVEDISYIRTGEEACETEVIKIKGNFSTKIEAIVKLILTLRSDDGDVKILVFSTWPAVLKILQRALTTNDIATELMLPHNLHQTLHKFKNKPVTALLLPIQLGSKGLNLIEATHVILVEPLLNPGDELQAVGRVHRIGQSKPTTVHKFIVKNTIEESLHHATSSNADVWDQNKVTLQQLKDLFVETLKDSLCVDNDDFEYIEEDDNTEDVEQPDFLVDDTLSVENETHSVENETHSVENETHIVQNESSCSRELEEQLQFPLRSDPSIAENEETHTVQSNCSVNSECLSTEEEALQNETSFDDHSSRSAENDHFSDTENDHFSDTEMCFALKTKNVHVQNERTHVAGDLQNQSSWLAVDKHFPLRDKSFTIEKKHGLNNLEHQQNLHVEGETSTILEKVSPLGDKRSITDTKLLAANQSDCSDDETST